MITIDTAETALDFAHIVAARFTAAGSVHD